MDLTQLCRALPKVELHAHLNGSVSERILQELKGETVSAKGDAGDCSCVTPKDLLPLELSECFSLFGKIHELIRTPEILYRVTKSVIEDFANDNVIYLELRTTPKAVFEIQTKELYIESVVRAIREKKNSNIVVKLLLSIDRKMSVADGIENVELAVKWHEQYPDLVLGIDFSGDPTKGDFRDFIPSLETAKERGLKITLHLPEVFNEEEALSMINFSPDRFGHAVHIHPDVGGSFKLWEALKAKRIPIEVCLTSNVVTKCAKTYEDHHVKFLYAEKMPFSICTDDSGIFRTTLSNELEHLATALTLNPEELWRICLNSVNHAFADSEEKKLMHAQMLAWWCKTFEHASNF